MTANAIAPGFIATDMLRQTAERMKVTFEQFLDGAAKEIPVGRVGQPEDIANAASFFCSDGVVVRVRPGALRGGRAEGMSAAFPSPEALLDAVGTDLGTERLDHRRPGAHRPLRRRDRRPPVDPRRPGAGRIRAVRRPIAHGYLSLSLLAPLMFELLHVDGTALVVNAGSDRVRFLTPVAAGTRVRAHGDDHGGRADPHRRPRAPVA